MSISKLFIFKKDTDASASIRGIEYQLLQTLREWIENYLNNKGETVYCEFDDDIAVFNSIASTVKFKQIKSYSENFSFKSKEVRKTILNFFILYANPAYFQHEPSFVFETNAGVISGSDEDSRFLSEWVKAQKSGLKTEDVDKILPKIKELINDLLKEQASEELDRIKERIETLTKKKPSGFEQKVTELNELVGKISEATKYLMELKDGTYIDFIKRISWTFHSKDPGEAISELKSEIEHLISKLPFNVEVERIAVVFTVLRWEVTKRAINSTPAERGLDSERLKNAVLSAEEDKWYVDIKTKFQTIDFASFTLGNFFELRGAARHARFIEYLQDDIGFWIEKLESFLKEDKFPETFQRTAVYELCFLAFFADTINKYNSEIERFFGTLEKFKATDELENSVVLLSIVLSAGKLGKMNLDENKVKEWKTRLIGLIEGEHQPGNTTNRKANLYDLRAEAAFQLESHDDFQAAFKTGIENLKKVVSLLDEATLFPIYKLSDRLTKYLEIYLGSKTVNLKELEQLNEEVDKVLAKKDGNFSLAKVNRDRGVMYFKKGFFIKSIEHFHKAKLYWFSDEGLKGTIISSLLISTAFNNLHLHYAGKYYGYATSYLVTSSPDLKQVEKYFPKGMAMAAISDYMAGCWLNFFDNADIFLSSHFELESDPLNIEINEEYREVIFAAITIQYVTGRLYPAFLAFVDFRIGRWQRIPADIIAALKGQVAKMLNEYDDEKLINWLSQKINQTPYNDAGEYRTVTWTAMGVTWEARFSNNYSTTAVAEQFIAMFQIFQVEMAQEDLCIFKTKVFIEINHTVDEFKFEYTSDNAQHKWLVKIPSFNLSDKEGIRVHYFKQIALMQTMLNYISLIPSDKSYEIFEQHVKDELGSKTSPAKPYEQIYREVISEETFKQSQRDKFPAVNHNAIKAKEVQEIRWRSDLSELYNPQNAQKAIKGRYKNCLSGVHLTLERFSENEIFKKTIAHFKGEGWKDWHILLAIYNAVLNYKSNINLTAQSSPEDYQREFQKLYGKDEKETYIDVPIEVFTIENIGEQFYLFTPSVLQSYGLSHKAPFAELHAILEVLKKRFNFLSDDIDHEPLF